MPSTTAEGMSTDSTAPPLDIRANRGEILTVKPDGVEALLAGHAHPNFGNDLTAINAPAPGASYNEPNRPRSDPEIRDFGFPEVSRSRQNQHDGPSMSD